MVKVYCYSRCTTCKKALKWLATGAKPTETAESLLKKAGILQKYRAMDKA